MGMVIGGLIFIALGLVTLVARQLDMSTLNPDTWGHSERAQLLEGIGWVGIGLGLVFAGRIWALSLALLGLIALFRGIWIEKRARPTAHAPARHAHQDARGDQHRD